MMMTPTTTTNNINASSGGGSCDGGGGSGNGGGNGSSSSTMLKKGPWTAAEDSILMEYVRKHGEGNWNAVQKNSGLSRCGKSCRLRWANHLRPNLKKGSFSPDEERLILELHSKLGNKWARMAAQLPGRTDNEIKNYWNTRVKRRQRAGLPLYPNDVQKQTSSFHHHHHHHHQHQHQQTSLTHQSLLQPPTQFSSLSSSQHQHQHQHQHQKTNFGSSLPLFDPLNLSTQTHFSGHHQNNNNNNNFLSTPMNGFKRFRAQNFGFSHQFSPTQHQTLTPTSSSVLFNPNLSSQFLPQPPLQFNPGNYDLMSPPPSLMQTHYHDQSNHMSPPGSSFSFQLELPSNQMSQPAANTAASGNNTTNDMDFRINTSLDDHQSNSGLLDALLQQAQTMGRRSGGHHDSRKERLVSEQEEVEEEEQEEEEEEKEKEKCRNDEYLDRNAQPSGTLLFSEHNTTATTPPSGSSNQWDESSPANSSIGAKKKEATDNEINSMEDDDLSSLLDIIPSTMMVSDFYNDGGEISNGGQSSGVTDEDIGLDMQLLPSNTNTATTTNNNTNTNTMEHDWNLGAWNNESELCYNQSS